MGSRRASSTWKSVRCSRRESGSSSCSGGSRPSPRSSAFPRISPSRNATRRSARSPSARPARVSSPSMLARCWSLSVSEQEPVDEEQLAEALAEELAKLRVENILVGALIQVSSVGYRTLGLTEETKDDQDLEQTK